MKIEKLIQHLRNRRGDYGITELDAQIIVATQNRYRAAIVDGIPDQMKIGFHAVFVVEDDGYETFYSGHHRYARALISGYKSKREFYIN